MFGNFFSKSYEDLSGSEFKQVIENTENAVLLDVRTPGEFNGGTIPGAINMDIMSYDFHDKVGSLDKNKTYFVFCRSGNRSGQACSMMSKMGLKSYNLAGGIGAWPF
ncbi:MAG: rhodanese-like domain-containing protein [Bacteroidia bacterium]